MAVTTRVATTRVMEVTEAQTRDDTRWDLKPQKR